MIHFAVEGWSMATKGWDMHQGVKCCIEGLALNPYQASMAPTPVDPAAPVKLWLKAADSWASQRALGACSANSLGGCLLQIVESSHDCEGSWLHLQPLMLLDWGCSEMSWWKRFRPAGGDSVSVSRLWSLCITFGTMPACQAQGMWFLGCKPARFLCLSCTKATLAAYMVYRAGCRILPLEREPWA